MVEQAFRGEYALRDGYDDHRGDEHWQQCEHIQPPPQPGNAAVVRRQCQQHGHRHEGYVPQPEDDAVADELRQAVIAQDLPEPAQADKGRVAQCLRGAPVQKRSADVFHGGINAEQQDGAQRGKHKHQCGPKTDGRPAFAVSFGTAQWFPSPYSFPREAPLCAEGRCGPSRSTAYHFDCSGTHRARQVWARTYTLLLCQWQADNAVTAPCAAALSQACLYAQRLQGFVLAGGGSPRRACMCGACDTRTPCAAASRQREAGRVPRHRPATAPLKCRGRTPIHRVPALGGVAGKRKHHGGCPCTGGTPAALHTAKRLHASTARQGGK